MRIISLIIILTIPFIVQCQNDNYVYSTIKIGPYHNQIIESSYYDTGGNYCAPPYESILFPIPINCDSAIILKPCNNFEWFSNDSLIYGENINERKVYLYSKKGILFRVLDNAEVFVYFYDNFAIFIREYISWNEIDRINPQVILYYHKTDQEIVLYEFDKEKYTFHDPNDMDGPGLPRKFDYFYGGIRGTISSTDITIENPYTFVIDINNKALTFWLDREWTETDIRKSPIPEEGIIKNSN
jgi:hypothetical protein